MSATPLPDGRNTRWDAHRRQRRNELIKSARAAVHSIGPEVSMEEIAQHAGTSKSVFYRYFEDKQGLQQAVAQASIDFMEAELKRAGSAARTTHDGLYTMVLSYLQLADSSPNVYNFSTAIPTGMAIFVRTWHAFCNGQWNTSPRNTASAVGIKTWPTTGQMLRSGLSDRPAKSGSRKKITPTVPKLNTWQALLPIGCYQVSIQLAQPVNNLRSTNAYHPH